MRRLASVRKGLVCALLLAASACLSLERDNIVDPEVDVNASIAGPDTLVAFGQVTFSVQADRDGIPFQWISSSPGILEPLGDGRFNARSNGTVSLTAMYLHHVAQRTVVVRQLPTGVTLAGPRDTTISSLQVTRLRSVTMRDAAGFAITGAVTATWSSSNPGAVTVTNGLIGSVGNGTAWIRASDNGFSDSALVRVRQVARSIAFGVGQVTLNGLGATATPTVSARDANGYVIADAQVSWSSDRPDVLPVSASGTVTALAFGSTLISARTDSTAGAIVARVLGGSAPSFTVRAGRTTAVGPFSATPLDSYFEIFDADADVDSVFVEARSGLSTLWTFAYAVPQGTDSVRSSVISLSTTATSLRMRVRDAAGNEASLIDIPVTSQPNAAAPVVQSFGGVRYAGDSLQLSVTVTDPERDARIVSMIGLTASYGFTVLRALWLASQDEDPLTVVVRGRQSQATTYLGTMVMDRAGNLSFAQFTSTIGTNNLMAPAGAPLALPANLPPVAFVLGTPR